MRNISAFLKTVLVFYVLAGISVFYAIPSEELVEASVWIQGWIISSLGILFGYLFFTLFKLIRDDF